MSATSRVAVRAAAAVVVSSCIRCASSDTGGSPPGLPTWWRALRLPKSAATESALEDSVDIAGSGGSVIGRSSGTIGSDDLGGCSHRGSGSEVGSGCNGGKENDHGPSSMRGHPSDVESGDDWPSLDLMVRSHSGEISQLLLFLRSVELYWPLGRWGVVVILDDDPFDAAAALTLPSFVRVVLEPQPPFWDSFASVPRKMEGTNSEYTNWTLSKGSLGYVRAQWSQFWADEYSHAEFIAWIDTDCIFYTYVTPTLLFDDPVAVAAEEETAGRSNAAPASGNPSQSSRQLPPSRQRYWRPFVTCVDAPAIYWPVIRTLGWPWVCEFMSAFPFVLHRATFRMTREAIRDSFVQQGGWSWREVSSGYVAGAVPGSASFSPTVSEFGEYFAWLGQTTRDFISEVAGGGIRDGRLLPCATTILGHISYLELRSRHAFSAMDPVRTHRSDWPHSWKHRQFFPENGVLSDGLGNFRCPALRGAIHLGYWSEYDKVMSPREYFKFGVHLMMLGRCGERDWPKEHVLAPSDIVSHLSTDTHLADAAISASAVCAATYCPDCPHLLWVLGLAHDGYKLSWDGVPLPPACPRRRDLSQLVERYTKDWVAVTRFLTVKSREAFEKGRRASGNRGRGVGVGGSSRVSYVGFVKSATSFRDRLKLNRTGGYLGLLQPSATGF